MQFDLRARHLELGPELRATIDRKLRSAFARFAQVIRRIEVTIADQNGPKGGDDKLCRLTVTANAPPIVIEEVDGVAERAVHSAIARAARSMARQLAKQRRGRRMGHPEHANVQPSPRSRSDSRTASA